MTAAAELLREHQVATERRLALLDAEIGELRRDRAADSADDEHDPEGVTLSAEWSRLEGLRAAAASDLVELDAAEARVAAGTYGVCIDCGRAIPAGRLEARPTAVRCVDCAAKALR
ncbi:TraR/DksA C4-type zinc finger protein [Microbacterium sp. SS28]|uniref:TraR/DksA family transcriptional regulator n=1 Tax=Microbacterium sp. SS28 TaxID=2919948 RepID=UPI001FAAEABD|nr:TraR/DksA C4-type zinc finger protein [Microbacterium sp. SS28]